MTGIARKLSAILLLLVLGLCVYRARTQSFAVDEAWVYNSFVSQPVSTMAKYYDACNHVLHTLLMKAALAMFGSGELALRIPSLLGAALYCLAVFRLTSLTLRGWPQLLAVALLTLNPLVLDFLVAARGYGLGLGLLFWALYCALLYQFRGVKMKWLRLAGLLAGLSTGANLVFLFPVAALGLTLMILAWRHGRRGLWEVMDGYGGPVIVTAFLINVLPLLRATPDLFYFGATNLMASANSLILSFVKVSGRWPEPSLRYFAGWIALTILPAALILLAAGFSRTVLRYIREQRMPFRLTPFILPSGMILFSAIALVFAHIVFGVKYPEGRTGIYFIPLFFFAAITGMGLVQEERWRHAVKAGNLAGVLFIFIFLVQTDNRYFTNWRYDAATPRLLRRMHEDFAKRVVVGQKPIQIGTSELISQTVLYYRSRRRLDWMEEPQTRDLASFPYEYYLLTERDSPLVGELGLRVLAHDQLSGETLARRTP
ncbi:MAG: hypothetical protein H7Y20_01095 [Bryobacteraceae bacterium]|nr:hypothetical protein [Bryobacteraceae bacterium]